VEALARRGVLPGLQAQGRWHFSNSTIETYLRKNPPSAGPVPQAWQSGKKSGPVPPAKRAAEVPAETLGSRYAAIPSPKLVNEPVVTTPASLELDLSILERLEIPEPEDVEESDET
jgi:hypothetical protein